MELFHIPEVGGTLLHEIMASVDELLVHAPGKGILRKEIESIGYTFFIIFYLSISILFRLQEGSVPQIGRASFSILDHPVVDRASCVSAP